MVTVDQILSSQGNMFLTGSFLKILNSVVWNETFQISFANCHVVRLFKCYFIFYYFLVNFSGWLKVFDYFWRIQDARAPFLGNVT